VALRGILNEKTFAVCVFLLFLAFMIPAQADNVQYDLSEEKYYHVDAEDNEDGWISYRKIDDEFTTLYQYDSKDDINANDTTSLIIEYDITSATKFGWSIQWTGDTNATAYAFILKNIDGEIFIDESYDPGDLVEKHFTMRLDSPSYRRYLEDRDSRVVIELLDILSDSQAEFQLYDRYGEKTRWENRQHFNLSDTMKFTLENCDTTEKFANCTVSTTTNWLNSTVWSAWDKEGDDLDELFFDSFYIYEVLGEGGYEKGLNTTTSVEIMFYSQGSKTLTLVGSYTNGTQFLSEHRITISGEGVPPPIEGGGEPYTGGPTIEWWVPIAVSFIVSWGAYAGIKYVYPMKDRTSTKSAGTFTRLLDLDDDEAPLPTKKYYELEDKQR